MISNIQLQMVLNINPTYLAGALGMTAGFVGVAAAIYLQLLADGHCPPEYVVVFFVVGSALLLMNVAIVNEELASFGRWLPVVGNAMLLVVELYGIHYVTQKISLDAAFPDPTTASDK